MGCVSRMSPRNLSYKAAAVWKKHLLEHLQRYVVLQVFTWCFPFLTIEKQLALANKLWLKVGSEEGFELTESMLSLPLLKNNKQNYIISTGKRYCSYY